MKVTCPNNNRHSRFITTVHEMHEQVIDNDAEFIRDLGCIETVHGPTKGNCFTCKACGAEAKVEE